MRRASKLSVWYTLVMNGRGFLGLAERANCTLVNLGRSSPMWRQGWLADVNSNSRGAFPFGWRKGRRLRPGGLVPVVTIGFLAGFDRGCGKQGLVIVFFRH